MAAMILTTILVPDHIGYSGSSKNASQELRILAVNMGSARPAVAKSNVSASPTLALNPTAGPPGTPVLFSGHGFTPKDRVVISYVDPKGAPKALGTFVAGSDGSLPQTTIIIPTGASPGSVGQLVASDLVPGLATAPFGVTPLDRELNVFPGTVAAGAITQVSGSGFLPNSNVVITLTDGSGAQVMVSQPMSTTGTGAILPVSLPVPASATSGIGTVNAVDSAGNAGGSPLVLIPAAPTGAENALHLLPMLATPGESVEVAAGGFNPLEPIQVLLGDANGSVTVVTNAALAADSNGRVSGRFSVPLDDATLANPPSGRPPGSGGNAGTLLTVAIRGAYSNATLRAPLVISGTRLVVVPDTTLNGRPITVIGMGFHAGETVTVTAIDSTGAIIQLGSAQASSGGVFSILVAAPPAPNSGAASSTFTITATGEASNLVATSRLVTTAA
ncbi:MAG: hypothetical protein JWO59_514, partial [Chloroflexi bacterium]|nr:hypothetical protein [Chloroflexota bacterium]